MQDDSDEEEGSEDEEADPDGADKDDMDPATNTDTHQKAIPWGVDAPDAGNHQPSQPAAASASGENDDSAMATDDVIVNRHVDPDAPPGESRAEKRARKKAAAAAKAALGGELSPEAQEALRLQQLQLRQAAAAAREEMGVPDGGFQVNRLAAVLMLSSCCACDGQAVGSMK